MILKHLLLKYPELKKSFEFHDQGTISEDLRFSFEINVAQIYDKIKNSPNKKHVLFGSELSNLNRVSANHLAYRVSKSALRMMAAVMREQGYYITYLEIPHTNTAMWPGGQPVDVTCDWIYNKIK